MKRTILVLVLFPALAFAGGKASSFLKETKLGANYYNAAAAIDGKLQTAWMLPGDSPGVGEWIEVDLPAGVVDKLQMVTGFARDETTFRDFARVKQARVDFFSLGDDQGAVQVGSTTVSFEDRSVMQTVDMPDIRVGGDLFGGRLRITVLALYPGEDYPNPGVSELAVVLKEFDAPLTFTAVGGAGPGHPEAHALDTDPKTWWQLPKGAPTFTLVSEGHGVSSVGFLSAPGFSRPKTVQVSQGGRTQTTVLSDKPTELLFAAVPAFNGYTGGSVEEIEVRVVDTYPGTSPDLGFATVTARATNRNGE